MAASSRSTPRRPPPTCWSNLSCGSALGSEPRFEVRRHPSLDGLDADAALVIGDQALRTRFQPNGWDLYDLGEEVESAERASDGLRGLGGSPRVRRTATPPRSRRSRRCCKTPGASVLTTTRLFFAGRPRALATTEAFWATTTRCCATSLAQTSREDCSSSIGAEQMPVFSRPRTISNLSGLLLCRALFLDVGHDAVDQRHERAGSIGKTANGVPAAAQTRSNCSRSRST